MSAPLASLRSALRARFVERDRVVDGLLIALLARQHVLLLGPPGTAKSLLARTLCASLEGARFFEWLLTKFSTPEELFGPVSLQALEAGRYERVIEGKIPEAHVAFLDEVFKSNSAILNALLTLMNERVYHEGSAARPVPLQTLVAASNELPDEDELSALYDRFLLRFSVGYVSDEVFPRLLSLEEPPPLPRFGLAHLDELRARVGAVQIPDVVASELVEIRRQLRKEGVTPSDRRFRQSLDVLRAAAVLEERDRVVTSDLDWLRDVLWTDPEDQEKVDAVLGRVATGLDDEAKKLENQAKEAYAYAIGAWPDETAKSRAALEAHAKLHDIEQRLGRLIERARERGRDTARLESLKDQIGRLQVELLGAGH